MDYDFGTKWSGGKADTLLFKASMANDLEQMRTAFAEGADLNAMNPIGLTTMDVVVFHGNSAAVRWLLENGARFPSTSRNGRNLWIQSRASKHREVESVLLSYGVKPTLTDRIIAWISPKRIVAFGDKVNG